jgi:hypothetical protein
VKGVLINIILLEILIQIDKSKKVKVNKSINFKFYKLIILQKVDEKYKNINCEKYKVRVS